ncbi:MAG: helix-turn-helix domain-containing protein [Patescibacteria group bacterium]
MKRNQPVSKEIKEQIIQRVKNEGKPVTTIAKEHGIPSSTVFTWLKRETENPQYYKELIKLRKEKQDLMEIIGELTVRLSNMEKK